VMWQCVCGPFLFYFDLLCFFAFVVCIEEIDEYVYNKLKSVPFIAVLYVVLK